MQKIKLDVDNLVVETFETAPAAIAPQKMTTLVSCFVCDWWSEAFC